MKKISNPLTIIGIFAGTAEVAGTVVLPFVSDKLEPTFIWYVMLFPIFLVSLFFFTLIKHNTVLYSPSDYKDEKHFMDLMSKTSGIIEEVALNPNIDEEVKIELQNVNTEILRNIINLNSDEDSETVRARITNLLKNGEEMKASDIEKQLSLTPGTINRTYHANIFNPNVPKIINRKKVSTDGRNETYYVYYLDKSRS